MNSKIVYDIIIPEETLAMLLSHIIFLSNVSLKLAQKLRNDFFQKIEELYYSPFKYPFLNSNIKEKTYRKINICKNYLIIYSVNENKIYINAIVNGKQNYFKFLD